MDLQPDYYHTILKKISIISHYRSTHILLFPFLFLFLKWDPHISRKNLRQENAQVLIYNNRWRPRDFFFLGTWISFHGLYLHAKLSASSSISATEDFWSFLIKTTFPCFLNKSSNISSVSSFKSCQNIIQPLCLKVTHFWVKSADFWACFPTQIKKAKETMELKPSDSIYQPLLRILAAVSNTASSPHFNIKLQHNSTSFLHMKLSIKCSSYKVI